MTATFVSKSVRLSVFVSSVQKELENEGIAVTELVASDPLLGRHMRPILFEQMPRYIYLLLDGDGS